MIKEILTNIYIISPLIFIGSLLLVLQIIPRISWIVFQHDLMEHPEDRSSHNVPTPSLAGVSFFITLLLIFLFIKNWDLDDISLNLIAALTIMFSIGLKDDLVYSSPKAKLTGELIAACFVIFDTGMEVTSLNGFLGIFQLSQLVSYGFVGLMILTIINAYNLIDGIDGLASTIGIVIFSIYGLLFYGSGDYFYFLLCISLIGILIGYLRYNLSNNAKIFMGDTGSLIIGFCIALFTVKFMAMDVTEISNFGFLPENRLLVIASIISLPLLDTFRVLGVRLLQKKNPFYPDRNHIHHILIDRGLSHLQVSVLLGFVNLILAIGTLFLSTHIKSGPLFILLIIVISILLVVLQQLKKKYQKKIKNKG